MPSSRVRPASPTAAHARRPSPRALSSRASRTEDPTNAEIDLRQPLRELAGYLDRLEAPGADFGHWVAQKTEKGVTSLGWYTLSALGQAFESDCYRLGFVFPFDWAAWARTTDGQRLLENNEAVATATPDQLRRLLTVIIRGDRFSDGTIADAFESGLFTAICRRATVLAGV